jgi:hypothetical protein
MGLQLAAQYFFANSAHNLSRVSADPNEIKSFRSADISAAFPFFHFKQNPRKKKSLLVFH